MRSYSLDDLLAAGAPRHEEWANWGKQTKQQGGGRRGKGGGGVPYTVCRSETCSSNA